MTNRDKSGITRRILLTCVFFCLITGMYCKAQSVVADSSKNNSGKLTIFKADHPFFQYTGRIDFSNPALPRFWAPGVYIKAKFKGTRCDVLINDEAQGGKFNYLEIVIDNKKPFRVQTNRKNNTIKVAGGLTDAVHTITICKNTESGIGYLEFVGLRCAALLKPESKPMRRIEFIGNSITCGTGSDVSKVACGAGEWHDQHNAYLSYGPITARSLNAEWQLTAVSGIGLIRSCCNMDITMPQVFDKLNQRANAGRWNFAKFQPQVVTVCLGQNDGVQDSARFCSAYVDFIKQIRSYYPKADIICLTSPMADAALTATLKNYLTGVVGFMNKQGDVKVSKYFFSKRYYHGCDDHPNLEEHAQIAAELSNYIQKLKGW